MKGKLAALAEENEDLRQSMADHIQTLENELNEKNACEQTIEDLKLKLDAGRATEKELRKLQKDLLDREELLKEYDAKYQKQNKALERNARIVDELQSAMEKLKELHLEKENIIQSDNENMIEKLKAEALEYENHIASLKTQLQETQNEIERLRGELTIFKVSLVSRT